MALQITLDPFSSHDRAEALRLFRFIEGGPDALRVDEAPARPVRGVRPRPLIDQDEAKTLVLMFMRSENKAHKAPNIARATNLEPAVVRKVLSSMRGTEVFRVGQNEWRAIPGPRPT